MQQKCIMHHPRIAESTDRQGLGLSLGLFFRTVQDWTYGQILLVSLDIAQVGYYQEPKEAS